MYKECMSKTKLTDLIDLSTATTEDLRRLCEGKKIIKWKHEDVQEGLIIPADFFDPLSADRLEIRHLQQPDGTVEHTLVHIREHQDENDPLIYHDDVCADDVELWESSQDTFIAVDSAVESSLPVSVQTEEQPAAFYPDYSMFFEWTPTEKHSDGGSVSSVSVQTIEQPTEFYPDYSMFVEKTTPDMTSGSDSAGISPAACADEIVRRHLSIRRAAQSMAADSVAAGEYSMHQPTESMDDSERRSAGKMAERVLKRLPFIVLGEDLLYYNGSYYEAVTEKDAIRLILTHFRDEVRSFSKDMLRSIVYFITVEPTVHVTNEDISQELLSFRNGVLDLSTGEMHTHSPEYRTFYRIEANYLPYAQQLDTPQFDRYLYMITGGDPVLTERLWQSIGYILSPDRRGKALFLLQGVSNSGKSVLTDLLHALFSDGAAISLGFHDLSERFAASEMVGKWLCTSNDMPAGALKAKAVGVLKELSGNDLVSVDVKYKNRAQFRCTSKLVMVTNHPLLLSTPDPAFAARIVTIPFCYSVPKEQWDINLLKKLLSERDAIVTKAIIACGRLRMNSYIFPGEYGINAVTDRGSCGGEFADVPSMIYAFVRNSYERCPENVVFIEEAYGIFMQTGCIVSMNVFSHHFANCAEQYFGAVKKRKRGTGRTNAQHCLIGIRLKQN